MVAVDDKARIVLLHQGGVECVRDHAAERGDADVPGVWRIELMAAFPADCLKTDSAGSP